MIAITGLAAIFVRVFAVTHLLFMATWALERVLEPYLPGADPAAYIAADLILLAISALAWIVLLIWAPALCRALAGPYRDTQIDLGLKGADMFRLVALIAGVMILVPASANLLFFHDAAWYLAAVIRFSAGLFLVIIGLMPDRFFRAIGALAPGAARRNASGAADRNGGDTPS